MRATHLQQDSECSHAQWVVEGSGGVGSAVGGLSDGVTLKDDEIPYCEAGEGKPTAGTAGAKHLWPHERSVDGEKACGKEQSEVAERGQDGSQRWAGPWWPG